MKTAISIPDEVFRSAEVLARKLKVSRSELYVTALRRYLETRLDDMVTESLNQVYSSEDSRPDPVLQTMQNRSLPRNKW